MCLGYDALISQGRASVTHRQPTVVYMCQGAVERLPLLSHDRGKQKKYHLYTNYAASNFKQHNYIANVVGMLEVIPI